MARTATNSTVEDIVDVNTVEEMNEETTKTTKKSIKSQPLEDSDEIEVVSLVPNVSYKDSKTFDMYEWKEVGHIEYMTFDTLKNMWRNNKGYFNARKNALSGLNALADDGILCNGKAFLKFEGKFVVFVEIGV